MTQFTRARTVTLPFKLDPRFDRPMTPASIQAPDTPPQASFCRLTLLLIALAAPSCGPGVTQVESEVIARHESGGLRITTVGAAILFGQDLGTAYLALADRNTRTQDIVSAGLIGITAGGALAAVDGASSETLTAFAVAGLALNSGAQYFNLRSASASFINAADHSLCIAAAGRAIPREANGDPLSVSMLMDGYRTARLILRRSLLREMPDYRSLVSQFDLVRSTSGFETTSVAVDYDALRSNVQACFGGG